MSQKRKKRELNYLKVKAFAAALALAVSLPGPGALAVGKEEKMLVPMGQAVGIQLDMDGVMVVGLVSSQPEKESPAAVAGLLPGDLIIRVEECEIHSAEDFKNAISNLDGETVEMTVLRQEEEFCFALEPLVTENGVELGLWLRDSVTGIGTLTYYDPETGRYGGLGHSVNDLDSGVIIPMGSGSIMRATVSDVNRGSCGNPGELCGKFDKSGVCGSIIQNTPWGIFGELAFGGPEDESALPTADEEEIELGPASVIANISGESRERFDIEIIRIYRGEDTNRSLMIKVTDPELLERTGGIVQGMSGSPIIQNGKLVGAVTHVLVNDPTGGFAVSVEDMLSASEN